MINGLPLLRYLPAVLGVMMALWYRNESTAAWGRAETYQLRFQQSTAANQSLNLALNALEQQQEHNHLQYQRELTASRAQGELLNARWHRSQQAEEQATAALGTLREAAPDEPICNPLPIPTYTAWADQLVPNGAIDWLYQSSYQANTGPARQPNGHGTKRAIGSAGPSTDTDSPAPESTLARRQN